MLPKFKTAVRRINRGIKHYDDLSLRWEAYIAGQPVKMHEQYFEVGSDLMMRVVLRIHDPLPPGLDGIAADAINNLRSALDHACWASAATLSPNRAGRTNFPFAGSQIALENSIKRRSADLHAEVLDYIRALRPFRDGDDLLWKINEERNTNQHAVLADLPLFANTSEIIKVEGDWSERCKLYPPYWNLRTNEMIVADLPYDGSVTGVSFNANMQLSFSPDSVLAGHNVVDTLAKFAQRVTDICKRIEGITSAIVRSRAP